MAASSAAPSVLPGATSYDKLEALCALNFEQQAVWFLNAFWDDGLSGELEKLWNWVTEANKLDLHKVGNALDELNAHRFLEVHNETMTVREMRTALRASGAISEGRPPKMVPLSHVLIFKYNVSWERLVNASQGDNAKELAEAQAKFETAKNAVAAAQAAAEAAKVARAELQAAEAELHAQEAAYNEKIADATRRSQEGGVVSRNKAANELAQLQAEDPLPLRKAKLTVAAALKKAERAVQAAEQALEHALSSLAAAEKYLEEVKMKGGSGMGSIAWMERALLEQRKYLPSSRGGIAK